MFADINHDRRRFVGSGGIGHNLPQEAPRAFAEAIINVISEA